MSSTDTLVGGRYRLERLLGRGGMAEVHLARDETLDRRVAIKILSGDGAGGFRERFEREARAAARLSHPNVVRVFDAGEDGGRRYIVMEYVDGESLAQVLERRGKLPPGEVVELGLQAAAGLQAAHAAGLVHRDVKPQNLLLQRDGELKIADFGIAWAAESTRLTDHGTLLGTAAYVAPEQIAADAVSPASDVYSLAAVLYEALTGRRPYEFDSLAELAARQQAGRIVPVRDLEPDVPPRVEDVLMRALARDPRYRPQTAAQFAYELAAAGPEAATEPLPARPAPVAPRRPARPRWAWVALLAVLAAAAGIALAVVLAGGGSHTARTRTRPARGAAVHVDPVPPASSAEAQAENLSAWIRRYSK